MTRRPGPASLADELRRLMPRDRWLVALLAEHDTLTTEHLTALAFPTATKARRRLALLHGRGILDRFRHAVRPGSQSWRWTLGPLGAALAAAEAGDPAPRPNAVRARGDRLAASPRLGHLLGVNGVFCALAAHARHHDGIELARWWSERRATRACGGLVRPDGHGVWTDHGHAVPFWLEYDTGTEPLPRVAEKLPGYARLSGTDLAHPVLFWLPNPAREDHLHAHLARAAEPAHLTIATAAGTENGPHDPAGPVWRVVGTNRRVRLADLSTGGAPWAR